MDHAHTLSAVALVLAMAFAGGTLLRQLKQPALVGYILVGLILGPSVLGVVQDQEQIGLLAEFGILLLLFTIGLELDLKSFGSVYKVSITTAVIQIAASMAIVGLMGWYMGWPLERIIIISFAISLSSTAVAIKLLEDNGSMKTPAGQTAIGVLVAQDLAIIPMLLIVGAFENAEFNPWDLFKIFFAVGFMAYIIYTLSKKGFVVKVPPWLRQQFETNDSSQVIIKALGVCFCAAALSGGLGLSASYGAFLAGLLIGSTQNKEKYEHHIRPVFDILMMFFFLSVGLLIDIKFMMAHIWTILALLFFVMVMKTVVNASVLHRLGMSRRNALIKGTILGQIGEFSFVLAGLGLSVGAIENEGYKYVVTLIALSLIFTPLWLKLIQRMLVIRRNMYRKKPAETDISPV